MPAAVVGGVIAGAGAIGAAAIGSKSQKKAANQAAQAQTDATAANNALTERIYNQNAATLAPFIQSGLGAGSNINALLGIAANNNTPTTQQAPAYAGQYGWNAMADGVMPRGEWMHTMGTGQPIAAIGQQPQQPTYQQAFDNYRKSTGYDFRFGEGMRALDAGAASGGYRDSGAAVKSALRFGQGIASDEFGNYLNALFNQQNIGLSAAGAQAGVGTNYVNTISNNNNAAASALGNAALLRGQANSNLWATAGNALGTIGGNLFASSFK